MTVDHMITGVELTGTQMWVLADSLRVGRLPDFLNIQPKAYIYDDNEFARKVLHPLQEMDVIDADFTIHPAVTTWLTAICDAGEFLDIVFNHQGKDLRLTLTRTSNNDFMYMWVSNGKVRLGVPDIYSMKSLMSFIDSGLGVHSPANIEQFSIPKNLLHDIVDQIISSPEEFAVEDIQHLIDKLQLPADIAQIMDVTGDGVKSTATMLVSRREPENDQISTQALTLLDTTKGRILLHPGNKTHGTETIVYESGTTDKIQAALEELFTSHGCTFWFPVSE